MDKLPTLDYFKKYNEQYVERELSKYRKHLTKIIKHSIRRKIESENDDNIKYFVIDIPPNDHNSDFQIQIRTRAFKELLDIFPLITTTDDKTVTAKSMLRHVKERNRLVVYFKDD